MSCNFFQRDFHSVENNHRNGNPIECKTLISFSLPFIPLNFPMRATTFLVQVSAAISWRAENSDISSSYVARNSCSRSAPYIYSKSTTGCGSRGLISPRPSSVAYPIHNPNTGNTIGGKFSNSPTRFGLFRIAPI